ncbi:MAG: molecular chaperone [Candidatus Dadabacteria bacterium]
MLTRWDPWSEFGSLQAWNPWRDFSSLQERINRVFDETLRGLYPSEIGMWTPAVDIHENDDSYIVKADLPGINKDDIQIDLKDSTLTIRGEKRFEEKVSRDDYLRIERAYGTFVRSFTLPQSVDADKIQAKYKDGVLELTIPKKEEAKPKQIQIM